MSDTTMRTAVWKGLNRMPYIEDGEMRSMKNLSSDAFPYLTTRKGREEYKFITKIPSPEGEAYRDVERLPEASIDELGKIYKITSEPAQNEYISGEFYYYDAASDSWVQGLKDEKFLGVASETVEYNGCTTFKNYLHSTWIISGAESIPHSYIGEKIKYGGDEHPQFERGKTYEYKINILGVSYKYMSNFSSGDCTKVDELPDTESAIVGKRYWYGGKGYICLADYCGEWKEVEEVYKIVSKMPDDLEDGMQVRYISLIHGAPVRERFYKCTHEVSSEGKNIYYYITVEDTEESVDSSYLPVASEENEGVIYNYIGPQMDEFAECYYENGVYDWKVVEHPKVSREVTLKEYLDDYAKCGLKEILEICTFNRDIAALIIDNSGKTKLYHNQSLWEVKNISGEEGKKLVPVGNRLVVGEAGNYLHIKDGEKTFHSVSEAFVRSISAKTLIHGKGGNIRRISSAYSSGGKARFELYSYGGDGIGYEELCEALSVKGTGFAVTLNGKTYYMKSESVTCEINKEVCGYVVDNNVYREYADILKITATDSLEDFNWDSSSDRARTFTFASTDPHYYDVVAWKKRLWGYDGNTLHGTIADIFDENGIVDWNTGDNTYTEAISQPLWQGGGITGIAALMDGLLYFKEDNVTIVTGNYPAIMNSNTIACRGLPPENRKSVAVANECVYYLSEDGVYRFGGGIPQCISGQTKIKGTDAVGASDGRKYWLSLKEDDGSYALYVYDIGLGIWHKEDDIAAVSFVMLGSKMYMATQTQIFCLDEPQEEVEWEAELWYDEGTFKPKKYKGFEIRGNLGECEVYLKPDDGEWQLYAFTEGKLSMRSEPFCCRELGIKFKGKGICELKSLDRIYEVVQ